MKVGLFVPCYVDQLYPQVGIATLRVLERAGCEVAYPSEQTCCGQPMANAGYERHGLDAARHFVRTFAGYDYVVAPSGSCVAHVREHYDAVEAEGGTTRGTRERHSGTATASTAGDAEAMNEEAGGGRVALDAVRHVRERTFELCQFLVEVLEVDDLGASFPHRVGLHAGCHGLRMLGLATPSEIQAPPFDHVRRLLEHVDGLELVELDRPDECCGFGGTFAVTEEAVSVRMGRDRVADHVRHGAEVITSTDTSCLMHLEGLIRRDGLPTRVVHVAEILAGEGDPVRA